MPGPTEALAGVAWWVSHAARSRGWVRCVPNEVRRGGHVDTSKVRLQEYLVDEWLPAIKASVKESTHAHYRRNVRQHLVPRLGAQRLSALSPAALNAMYADLLANGRADGTGGSHRRE